MAKNKKPQPPEPITDVAGVVPDPLPHDVNVEAFVTEMTEVAKLKPHPRNYRSHPEDQILHLMESIKEHGLYRNVVVARDGTILAGHGVVEAVKKLALPEIPVVRLEIGPNDPRALKLLAGDNEIARIAGVDDRALTELLREIKITDPLGLLGTGYDDRQLAALAMVTRPAGEIADFDAAAEWVGMPKFDVGEKCIELHISFETAALRDQFVKEVLLDKTGSVRRTDGTRNIWTMWWPPADRERHDAVVVQEPDSADAPDEVAEVDAAISKAS